MKTISLLLFGVACGRRESSRMARIRNLSPPRATTS